MKCEAGRRTCGRPRSEVRIRFLCCECSDHARCVIGAFVISEGELWASSSKVNRCDVMTAIARCVQQARCQGRSLTYRRAPRERERQRARCRAQHEGTPAKNPHRVRRHDASSRSAARAACGASSATAVCPDSEMQGTFPRQQVRVASRGADVRRRHLDRPPHHGDPRARRQRAREEVHSSHRRRSGRPHASATAGCRPARLASALVAP